MKGKEKLDNFEVGVWVENFSPGLPTGSPFAAGTQAESGAPGAMEPGAAPVFNSMAERYAAAQRAAQAPAPAAAPQPSAPASRGGDSSVQITSINIVCRAVDRSRASASANSDLAYAVKQELTNSAYFSGPIVLGDMRNDDTNTFTFPLTVQLKHPFKM